MNVDTMARLFELKNVVGVKDATGKIDRVSQQREAMGADFIQLSGDDSTALAVMAHGGHGCISVTANVAPKLLSEFQSACLAGDYRRALTYQDRLMPLHVALFLEPNPAGIKYAMSVIGKMRDEVRLPLVKVSPPTEAKIRAAMVHAGLIN
jgi:4-hydroxy-tetrahydrodipicolinate synthase